MYNTGEEPECDEELSYLIKCLEDDIPYKGFFHEMYSCEEPFEYEERDITSDGEIIAGEYRREKD